MLLILTLTGDVEALGSNTERVWSRDSAAIYFPLQLHDSEWACGELINYGY